MIVTVQKWKTKSKMVKSKISVLERMIKGMLFPA